MSESRSAARADARRLSLEQLRKQAKELLRQYRAGEASAESRFGAADAGMPHSPIALADAQFVIARELGFATWASLKHHLEEEELQQQQRSDRVARYERLAADLAAATGGDGAALQRVTELFGGANLDAGRLSTHIRQRLGIAQPEDAGGGTTMAISVAETKRFVARLYGFEGWDEFAASAASPPAPVSRAMKGYTASPPFFRVDWKENWLEPRPPVSERDWDELFEAMRGNRITGLRAAGQMTDAALERLATRDTGIVSLSLDGCRRITDAGLRHLARIPQLEELNLTGCTSITDDGLAVLGELAALREFSLYHHQSISDAGLQSLARCERLERVSLLGTTGAGDGVLRTLAGKPRLRHLKSGNGVTDAGLQILHQYPVFRSWQGGEPRVTLMGFEAEPNYLLLRGQITDAGIAALAGLEGLFALNLDDSRLALSAIGIAHLARLPHLEWLGFDATDETMAALAALPHLRMLMCQDTSAGDAGFAALARSRTIEYIWGRRCYNLGAKGFSALAEMPALRGLSVSCKNVDDDALSALPRFPRLTEFMPMDVPDAGFRHVGRCANLEALWCMYCRDTGDAATEQIAGLGRLTGYYAGQTRITDRSLQVLSRMTTLERINFWSCGGVTDAGVSMLTVLPRLEELTIDGMPAVTRTALGRFPERVRVNYS